MSKKEEFVQEAPGEKESPAEQRAHVQEILEKISDVLFVSFASAGPTPEINARPLHVKRLEEDGALWFMVSAGSSAVSEVRRSANTFVSGHEGRRWIQLNGRSSVVTDRAQVRALWTKGDEVWFPDGPEDPDAVLIQFTPIKAEYWDNSGVRGLEFLFEAARALVQGEAPRPKKGSHGEVHTP